MTNADGRPDNYYYQIGEALGDTKEGAEYRQKGWRYDDVLRVAPQIPAGQLELLARFVETGNRELLNIVLDYQNVPDRVVEPPFI